MPFPKAYNPNDAEDILRYAQWLIGKTFYDVLEMDLQESQMSHFYSQGTNDHMLDDYIAQYGRVKRKGGLGNLIEEHFFHYNANSYSEADFSQARLELQSYPIRRTHYSR